MKQEWLTNEQVRTCPICKSKRLPEKDQPVAGTHGYTIKYECGAEVDCAIGHDDSCKVELKCGEVREDLLNLQNKELRRLLGLYQSGIAKHIDLEKVKKHSLLPVETKMITTLREWASQIEDGKLGVIKDYSIGVDSSQGMLMIDFILKML